MRSQPARARIFVMERRCTWFELPNAKAVDSARSHDDRSIAVSRVLPFCNNQVSTSAQSPTACRSCSGALTAALSALSAWNQRVRDRVYGEPDSIHYSHPWHEFAYVRFTVLSLIPRGEAISRLEQPATSIRGTSVSRPVKGRWTGEAP